MASQSSSIYLSFVWKGISRTSEGNPKSTKYEIAVDRVNLVFENAKSKIGIEIPKDLKPSTSKTLPFLVTKEGQTNKRDLLHVPIQTLKSASVVVVYYNYSDNPEIQREIVKQNKSEPFEGLDFNTIQLQIPETLESGKHYILRLASDKNLFLTAKTLLKPEETPQPEPKKEKPQENKENKKSKKVSGDDLLINVEKYEELFGNYFKKEFEKRRKQ